MTRKNHSRKTKAIWMAQDLMNKKIIALFFREKSNKPTTWLEKLIKINFWKSRNSLK